MRKEKLKNYPNYIIHEDGSVWSNYHNKFIKHSFNKNGYKRVCVTNDRVPRRLFIHRLLAETWIPNPENKPQINHINGIKTDNCLANLEWCTNSENQLHAYKNGLNKISDLCKQKVIAKNKLHCGNKHYLSIKVLNTKTGKIHDTIKSASEELGIKLSSLARILRGERINNTPYIYFMDSSG